MLRDHLQDSRQFSNYAQPFGVLLHETPTRKTSRRASRARLGRAFVEATTYSGVGAVVKITPVSTGVEITLNNRDWNKKQSMRLAEITNAQSGGNALWKATVKEQSGSLTCNWDAAAVPSTVGIVEGAECTLKEYFGTSAKYKSQAIIIESVEFKADAQGRDICTLTITYKGNGAVTDN